jgi:replicative DNA helicase
VVMFIYRKDVYERDNPEPSTDLVGLPGPVSEVGTTDLIIAKQRNGPTGEVTLAFHKTYARFDPLAEGHYYPMAAHLN